MVKNYNHERKRSGVNLWLAFAVLVAAASSGISSQVDTAREAPGSSSRFSAARQIVVLYDERPELPGLAMVDAGFVRALTAGQPGRVEIYRESMDLSRFDSAAYRSELRDYLRAKYAARNIDVVVAVMEPALDFLLSHRRTVFPGTPIVFCGIDRRQLGHFHLPSDVTGVLLKREFAPTLELAVRLHPKTDRIVVVSGASEFDALLLAQAREEFQAFEKRFAFTYLTALPLPALLEELSQLPANTVVLYVSVFRDGANQGFVPHEVAERVSEAASVPVYGFVDQYLGRGIVGGCLYSMEAHGEEAAELVRMVLSGKKPEELPLIEPKNNVTVFDWRQLQRWGIHRSRLPPGSQVRFHTPGFWDQYKWRILLTVAAACAALGGVYFRHIARLQATHRAQAAFTRELILSQEHERKRIAGELHDGLGQDLLVIKNRLSLLATTAVHPPEVARQLKELSETALRTIGDVRSISQGLRPVALEQVGLTKAIEWMIEQIRDASKIKFETEMDNLDGLLGPELEINLYRIVQEALNNVIKHTQATEVIVTAKRVPGQMSVSILDNGRGFDAEHQQAERSREGSKATLGLAGMEERAKLLNGKIEIQSAQGTGTRVTFTMPLAQQAGSLRDSVISNK